MIYDFTTLSKLRQSQPQHMLLRIKHGHVFHPRLPTRKRKYVILAPGKVIKVFNPMHIHATEISSVDIGKASVIALKMISNMFCSAGKAILKSDDMRYAHHNQIENFMIEKITNFANCHEILIDHFTPKRQFSITEIFVKVTSTGNGSIVRLIPLNYQAQRCTVNESVILREVHSNLNIFYQYTFVNTANKTIEWHSIFDSDIYLVITKVFLNGDQECHTHMKSVLVVYVPQINVRLKNLPPEATVLTQHDAR